MPESYVDVRMSKVLLDYLRHFFLDVEAVVLKRDFDIIGGDIHRIKSLVEVKAFDLRRKGPPLGTCTVDLNPPTGQGTFTCISTNCLSCGSSIDAQTGEPTCFCQDLDP